MTRWKLTVFVLLIIIVVGLSVYFVFGRKSAVPAPITPPAPVGFGEPATSIPLPNQTRSPTLFATNFYTWYLANRATGKPLPPPDSPGSVLVAWLTPRFIGNWQSIITNTNADPVLWAQDAPSTWGPGLQASLVSESSATSSVQVTIGSGATIHTYTVQLVKTGESWEIDSVAGTF